VSFEAGFLLGYTVLLVVAALGLHRLGRGNPSPWAGRVLAGHRRQHPETAQPPLATAPTWPHVEQSRLHTGIAIVAAAAGLLLAAVGVWRHRGALEVTLLASACTAAAAAVTHLARELYRE
jgi:hypothetical protein